MRTRLHYLFGCFVVLLTLGIGAPAPAQAQAQERLCDPGNEDCRSILINYIRNETVGIDVAFWFMEDARYTTELIRRHQAGVPVRVLIDPRADATYPLNAQRLQELQNAGIPMRKRLTTYILHWKMMLFHGQNIVEFSGANYSADAWRPATSVPYENYTDEAILFTGDTAIVDSFRKKFDDFWVDTTGWANHANITTPLTKRYPATLPVHSSMNFPPEQNYRTRSVSAYNAERRKIDVIMYRITDKAHTDAILAAVARGIPVRLITEPVQYRLPSRMWHSWNVDRLYMGGVQIMHRAHAGLNHQKSVILYDQNGSTPGDQSMIIFGSSNWTSPSANGQVEHNLFTTKPGMISWFVDQFERKWNNTGGIIENVPFVPLPPDKPTAPLPASPSTGVSTSSLKLTWFGGPWAHLYDLYLDTNPNPTALVAANLAEPSSKTETSTFSYTLPFTLTPGTTYYWKVVGKTMALQTRDSNVWSFTTAGTPPPPPPTPAGSGDIVLHAAGALTTGAWIVTPDSAAAGGARLRNPNAGAAKVTAASASPANYFELSFTAEAGRAYRLWIRGKAESNSWANDSVYVQFSDSVTSSGAATWRIGTTSATEMNLEDCNGCGLSNWGWQDNGYGLNVLGTPVYFQSTGVHTVRVQVREDGLSIDQIVLSPTTYMNVAPGPTKNDTTYLAANDGSGSSPPPPPPPPAPSANADDLVVYAGESATRFGGWRVEADATAAGGQLVRHPNANAAKISTALASPTHYFEVPFTADAAKPYRLWIRGKADGNSWANDSIYAQFDGAVTEGGTPVWRIGSTSAAEVNLEACSGCGLSGWGWQDNGWGTGVLGPLVYFQTTGPQTLRVQTREDGLAIDQIVLSGSTFIDQSPGAETNDSTILAR
jgi:phosphatidylserine/phosphatidylglycerophosphate/cardiolipin synthase-like enzyme